MDAPERKLPRPRFGEIGDQIVADRCVWCGESGKMSRSHLFPRMTGARFAPRITCSECNKHLGAIADKEAKKNAFLTAALVKLGIQGRREAYRHAKKFDEELDLEMHITKNGPVKPVKKVEGNRVIGTPQELKEHMVRQFKKKRPNWPVDEIEKFYDDDKANTLKYAGMKLTKQHFDGGVHEIRIGKLARDPHPYLVFKIVYEYLAMCGMLDHSSVREMLERFVTVDGSMPDQKIVFNESELVPRVYSNTQWAFRKARQLEEIAFTDYHSVMIGLSTHRVLHMDVVFFGVIRSTFILGRLSGFDSIILPATDCVLVDNFDSSFEVLRFPNVSYVDGVIASNMSADQRCWELEQAGLDMSLEAIE